MALEWIKDQADKALKVASDTGSTLLKEANSLVESAEHKLLGTNAPKAAEVGSAKDAQTTKSEPDKTVKAAGLSSDLETQKAAALKAELQAHDLPVAALPTYDSSVLDTVRSVAGKAASSFGSTIGTVISYIGAPIVAGAKLTNELIQVSEHMVQNKDYTLTFGKVVGAAADLLKDEYNKLFDDSTKPQTSKQTESGSIEFNQNIYSPEPAAVTRVSAVDEKNLPKDMMHWLFDANEKPNGVAVSDNLFSNTNEKQEKTEITALPGHVHIEKRDGEGKLETVVDKTSGKTIVLHGKETVSIENGKEVVKGDGYTVSWDAEGKRHIVQDNGLEVIRKGNEVQVLDMTVKPNLMTNGHVGFTNNQDNLPALTEEIRSKLGQGEAYMLAIKGGGIRTIFQSGGTFDVKQNLARMETKDHQVFQLEMKNNQIYLRQDGQLYALNDERIAKVVTAEDGKYKIGGLVIDPKMLCVESENRVHIHNNPTDAAAPADTPTRPQIQLDFLKGLNVLVDQSGHNWNASIHPDNSSTISDEKKTTSYENNNNDNKVVITTPAAKDAPDQAAIKTTVDIGTTTVETTKVLDTPEQTTIKNTDTLIKDDKTVQFKDGPTVNPDGSVRVDKNTFVDKDNKVTSHGWESSAAQGQSSSVTQATAQNVAMNINGKANSMFSKANSGVVRWTEVAVLNSALGDVLSLMGVVPADSSAYAILMNSYGLLLEAISVATPKAQATEMALDKGITTPSLIKAASEGASEKDLKKNRMAA